MVSELILEIYEDGNPKSLTIRDVSVYNTEITVDCENLCITLPGYEQACCFEMDAGFTATFTSHSFNMTDPTCNTTTQLPDGIYQIHYSICPNSQVYTEYYYLRQTQAYKLYTDILCSLQIDACDIQSEKVKNKLEELRAVKQYLEAAKAYVESCGSANKGLELHNYALDRLEKLKTNCNNC